MDNVIKLNHLSFQTETELESFLQSSDAVPFLRNAINNRLDIIYKPGDKDILRLIRQFDTDGETYLRLYSYASPSGRDCCAWEIFSTTPRKAGGDYFDETPRQKKYESYLETIRDMIDRILVAHGFIEITRTVLQQKETKSSNSHDLPY